MTYRAGFVAKPTVFLSQTKQGSARETDRALNCAGATLPAVSHDLGPSQEAGEHNPWDGENFRSALMIDGQTVEVVVRQDGQPDRARLQVNLTGRRLTERTQGLAKSLLDLPLK